MIKESAITTWSEILSLFRSATWISHNNNQRNKKPNNVGLRNKRKKIQEPNEGGYSRRAKSNLGIYTSYKFSRYTRFAQRYSSFSFKRFENKLMCATFCRNNEKASWQWGR